MNDNSTSSGVYELSITRLVDVPRERLFQGWTDPALLTRWFAPAPFVVSQCEVDLRPGGLFRTTMRGPDGTEYPTDGVFLEVSAPSRLVFTDAFKPGWLPAPEPFMTAVITLEEENGRTRYTARALHRSEADRQKHAAMGFEKGWNQCLDQLIALVSDSQPSK